MGANGAWATGHSRFVAACASPVQALWLRLLDEVLDRFRLVVDSGSGTGTTPVGVKVHTEAERVSARVRSV
jgi:hypothetical protein